MKTTYLLLGLAAFALVLGACKSDKNSATTETSCTDGVDNDGDGNIDCTDSDCVADPACFDPCGDGTCDPAIGEDPTTCPVDCADPCGDGTCDPAAGEDALTCPADSLVDCGDATCDPAAGEDDVTCPADCSAAVRCATAVALEELTNVLGGTFYEGNGVFDPAGAANYFTFDALAGDWFELSTQEATATADIADTVITLYTGDGATVLAENDDAFPRINTDSELFHRFASSGTFCVKVEEWSTWAGDPAEGGPTFDYRIIAVPLDFAIYDFYSDDSEPNDDAASADPLSWSGTGARAGVTIAGFFDGDGDQDVFIADAPVGALSFSFDFTPGGGIDNAYGASDDMGIVELLARTASR